VIITKAVLPENLLIRAQKGGKIPTARRGAAKAGSTLWAVQRQFRQKAVPSLETVAGNSNPNISLSGIALPRSPENSFIPIVQRLKSFVTVVLVAIWLPASSHAFLQHVGFIHQVHEHDEPSDADHDSDAEHPHEHDADNHAAADGLCLTSSAKVQLEKPTIVALLPWLAAALLISAGISSPLEAYSGPSPPGVAPPELSHRWQFTFRAAPPVRAPSFVS